jgi:3-methyladenine DNA glycosylase AlkD
MTTLSKLKSTIRKHKNPKKIAIYQNFFKTGKGQYGEGDIFYGLTMPEQRTIVKDFTDLSLKDIRTLLNSKIHEERMIALLILVKKYEKTNDKKFVNFYLKNAKRINNWDLVDVTAPNIVGHHLLRNKAERKILYKLARSKNLWEKRISIISTFTFLRNNQLADTIKISKILLKDEHDLIHKAVGWMLRELGKKDEKQLVKFLKTNYNQLPRTTLRYSIEKFPEKRRKEMLVGKF